MRLSLIGDVQLGRSFNQVFAQNPNHNPWGNTGDYLSHSDLIAGNLECSITDSIATKYPNKVFNYRLSPQYADILRDFGTNANARRPRIHFGTANNHILDFGKQGMFDTFATLDALSITHAGAGQNLAAAQRPVVLSFPVHQSDVRVHLFSAADHIQEWAATPTQAGIFWFDPERPDVLVQTLKQYRDEKRLGAADIVVAALHFGPNWETAVSQYKQNLVRRLVQEAGVRVVQGTSAHHLESYEWFPQHPNPLTMQLQSQSQSVAFYSLGDFVDDYAVDPKFRNDIGVIASLDFDATGRLVGLEHWLTYISNYQVNLLLPSTSGAVLGGRAPGILGDDAQRRELEHQAVHTIFY